MLTIIAPFAVYTCTNNSAVASTTVVRALYTRGLFLGTPSSRLSVFKTR